MSNHDYLPFDWDIKSWDLRESQFYVSFCDGTEGVIPVSDFPSLNGVPESALSQVRVCPWYVALRQDSLEWEVSEAELYKRVNGEDARDRAQQKYLRLRSKQGSVAKT